MSTRTYRYCIFHGVVIFALNGEDKMRSPIPGRRRRGFDFTGPGDPVAFNEHNCNFLRSVRSVTFPAYPPLELDDVINLIRKREKVDIRESLHGWEKDVKQAEMQFADAKKKQSEFEERAKRVALGWEDEHNLRDFHSARVQKAIDNWTFCMRHLLLAHLRAKLITGDECDHKLQSLPKCQEDIEQYITSRRH